MTSLRIGIVAGEASGDILAAALMRAIKMHNPAVVFEGVAGPRMLAAGCKALFPLEKLSVMAFVEVVARLRELLGIRRSLIRHFLADPPDIFIGVDAPDFNLTLERRLKQAGIPTVHYVSPSVWAWRQYRVRKIADSVDHMLTLFPFEAEFYKDHNVPVTFVGHTLADQIPLQPDRSAARRALGLPEQGRVVALLPGSRTAEVQRLGGPLIDAARWCLAREPDLRFVVPFANPPTRAQFEAILTAGGVGIPIIRLDGHSHEAMAAADVVVLASGTATLEAALLKRPMVVVYKLAPLNHWIMKRLVKVTHIALPNLLAGRRLVPELIQEQATPEAIGAAVLAWLGDAHAVAGLQHAFEDIHHALRQNASERAAETVLAIARKP